MHQEEDLPSPVDLPLHWMSSFGLTVLVMSTPSCVSEVHQSERMPTACLPHPMTWIGPGLGYFVAVLRTENLCPLLPLSPS